jgi:type II secretory pathway component GspD/PulD (secretin)
MIVERMNRSAAGRSTFDCDAISVDVRSTFKVPVHEPVHRRGIEAETLRVGSMFCSQRPKEDEMARFSTAIVLVAGALCLSALAESACAQSSERASRRSSLLRTLREDFVQGELKLTAEQKTKIEQLINRPGQGRTLFREFFARIREAQNDAERDAIRAEMRTAVEKSQQKADQALADVLSETQLVRLKQLALQQSGPRGLAREDIAAELHLTDQQKQQIGEAVDEYRRASRELGFRGADEDRQKLVEKFNSKVDSILTPEQLAAWKSKLGTPASGDLRGSRRDRRADRSRSDDGERRSSRRRSRETSGGNRSNRSQDIPTGDAVASFGRSNDAPASSTQQTPGAGELGSSSPTERADEPAAASRNAGLLTFNFQNADWETVLKLFADSAGLTLDLNDIPPGTFNYYDRGSYTPTEALDILNGYLLQKGHVLVRRDKFLVVVNIDDGIPPNLVPNVPVEELPRRGRNELLSIVVPLEDMDVEQAATDIEPLLGPQGKSVALRNSNSLIVTDIGSNLRRVHRLLRNASWKKDPKALTFRAYHLQFIAASDAERIVRSLLGLSSAVPNVSGGDTERSSRSSSRRSRFESFFSGRDSSRNRSDSTPAPTSRNANANGPKVASDPRTNSLLVTATSTQLKIVDDLVKTIDVTDADSVGQTVPVDNRRQLKVYELKTATASEAGKTLNALLPGVVVNEDAQADRVHVFATLAEHREIATLIQQIDGFGSGKGVAVIPIGGADNFSITTTLRSLFAAEGNNSPVIQRDASGQRLIVRGTSEQLAQVRSVLSQLGGEEASRRGQGLVRRVPLRGRDPVEFVRLLEKFWSASGRNPLRIVIPSDSLTSPAREANEGTATPQSLRETSPPVEQKNGRREPRAEILSPFSVLRASQTVPRDSQSEEPHGGADPDSRSDPGNDPADDDTDRQLLEDFEQLLDADDESVQDNESGNRSQSNDLEDEEDAASSAKRPKIPIAISVSGDGLILTSEDTEALDRLERLIDSLSAAVPERNRWTVFYLRTAEAEVTATMLKQLLPTATVSSPANGTQAGIGLGSNLSASVLDGSATETLRIVPEVRSNSLFVSGPPAQVRDVEQLLKILDASELPESLRDRIPRSIFVQYADATEIATIIKDVYREEMGLNNESSRRSRSRRSRFSDEGSSGRLGDGAVRLSVGVDTQTNQLIVSSGIVLFRQVESLVQALDEAARAARQTVRVVGVGSGNPAEVREALGALLPKVRVSTTAQPAAVARPEATNGSRSRDASQRDEDRSGRDEIRRFFERRFRDRSERSEDSDGGSRRGRGDGDRESRRRSRSRGDDR